MPLPSASPTQVTVAVRASDIDLLGHVNQAIYHDFLQQGRSALELDALVDAPRGLVVSRVELDYRSEVRLADETVIVQTTVESAESSQITLRAEILKSGGIPSLTAATTLVPRSAEARKPGERDETDAVPPSGNAIAYDVALRFSDFDQRGRLCQSAYHAVLEEGRSHALGQLRDEWSGLFVVAHVEVDHQADAVLGDGRIAVHSAVARVGSSSFAMDSTLYVPEGIQVASCRTVFVAWDPERRSSRKLSDGELSTFGAALIQA